MEDTVKKKYDVLVVDCVNFAYRTFKMKDETPLQVSKKSVYKNSICNFILTLESLKDTYLNSDGEIYLLFDNYFSRADLRSTYMFADRKKLNESYKATRKKESKEFYNSINFLRYYYLIGPSIYHTARIDNLEADDLVEPLFNHLGINKGYKSALMITTDADWTRYLADNVDWLPDLSKSPETITDLSNKLGFKVSKSRIILYKAIFGDASDNIQGIVPDNENNRKEFISLLDMIDYPEYLIEMSRGLEFRNQFNILKNIAKNEKAFLVNLQIISPIPCGVDTLLSHLTSGRNAETMYKTVREVMGLEESEGFVFGNVKRNRVS